MLTSQAEEWPSTVNLSTDECGQVLAAPKSISGKLRNDLYVLNSSTFPGRGLLTLFLKELRTKWNSKLQ